jgi:Domain of unknown function (DUF6316)
MADRRAGESKAFSAFRPDRFFQERCQWYFYTREGAIEGPFQQKKDAENRLEDYIKVMVSGMLPADDKTTMDSFQ